jgi:Zn-dependent peptidase ImmA (M78 family)
LGGRRSPQSFEYQLVLSDIRGLLCELKHIAADDEEFVRPDLPHYSERDDPAVLGMKERTRLGVGINEQIKKFKANDAFKRWRAIIEKQGVSVFLKKYPWTDSRGFSLHDDLSTPAIVINKAEETEVAKTFSLIHEYAHLLIRRPGLSDHNPKNPVEAFCNRFAAAFLMPDAALKKLLPRWPNEPVDWTFGEVAAWARQLKVSQAALALRLEQAKLAPEGFYSRFNRPNLPVPAAPRLPPKVNPSIVRIFEIGGNLPGAVMGALDRGTISEVTAVQALGLNPEYFDKVRANVARPPAGAGVYRQKQ